MGIRCLIKWDLVISDILAKGYSYGKISKEIEVPKPTVYGWSRGAEPCHGDGERLIKLWMKTTKLRRKHLPTID